MARNVMLDMLCLTHLQVLPTCPPSGFCGAPRRNTHQQRPLGTSTNMSLTPCSISHCKSCWRSPVRVRSSTLPLPPHLRLFLSPSPIERAKRPADGGQAQGGEAAELRTSLLALVSQKPHIPRNQRNARRSSSRHHRVHRKPEWKCRKCSTFNWGRHATAVSTMRVPQPGQSKREGAGSGRLRATTQATDDEGTATSRRGREQSQDPGDHGQQAHVGGLPAPGKDDRGDSQHPEKESGANPCARHENGHGRELRFLKSASDSTKKAKATLEKAQQEAGKRGRRSLHSRSTKAGCHPRC